MNGPRYKAKNFLKTVNRLQKRIRAVEEWKDNDLFKEETI